MFRIIELIEPQRGKDMLTILNQIISNTTGLFDLAAVSADIFVLTYPILLIALFLYGWKKNQIEYQQDAVKIMFSVVVATLITIAIQQFVRKERPETLQGLHLILNHLPTISFPSDHATVSMAMAIGSFLVFQNKKQYPSSRIATIPRILLMFSVVMGIARVSVAVHRPTDIIAGWIIGIAGGLISYIMYGHKYTRYISMLIIRSINLRIGKIKDYYTACIK